MKKRKRWIIAFAVVLAVAAVDFVVRRAQISARLLVLAQADERPIAAALVRTPSSTGTSWRELGRTDAEGELPMPLLGMRRVRVEAEGYRPWEAEFEIERGQTWVIRLTPEEQAEGR